MNTLILPSQSSNLDDAMDNWFQSHPDEALFISPFASRRNSPFGSRCNSVSPSNFNTFSLENNNASSPSVMTLNRSHSTDDVNMLTPTPLWQQQRLPQTHVSNSPNVNDPSSSISAIASTGSSTFSSSSALTTWRQTNATLMQHQQLQQQQQQQEQQQPLRLPSQPQSQLPSQLQNHKLELAGNVEQSTHLEPQPSQMESRDNQAQVSSQWESLGKANRRRSHTQPTIPTLLTQPPAYYDMTTDDDDDENDGLMIMSKKRLVSSVRYSRRSSEPCVSAFASPEKLTHLRSLPPQHSGDTSTRVRTMSTSHVDPPTSLFFGDNTIGLNNARPLTQMFSCTFPGCREKMPMKELPAHVAKHKMGMMKSSHDPS